MILKLKTLLVDATSIQAVDFKSDGQTSTMLIYSNGNCIQVKTVSLEDKADFIQKWKRINNS